MESMIYRRAMRLSGRPLPTEYLRADPDQRE
jgi:hypothetical protein